MPHKRAKDKRKKRKKKWKKTSDSSEKPLGKDDRKADDTDTTDHSEEFMPERKPEDGGNLSERSSEERGSCGDYESSETVLSNLHEINSKQENVSPCSNESVVTEEDKELSIKSSQKENETGVEVTTTDNDSQTATETENSSKEMSTIENEQAQTNSFQNNEINKTENDLADNTTSEDIDVTTGNAETHTSKCDLKEDDKASHSSNIEEFSSKTSPEQDTNLIEPEENYSHGVTPTGNEKQSENDTNGEILGNGKKTTDEETTGHTLRTSPENIVIQEKEKSESAEEGEDTHHDENQASEGNDDNDNGVQSDVEVDSRIDSPVVTNDTGEGIVHSSSIEEVSFKTSPEQETNLNEREENCSHGIITTGNEKQSENDTNGGILGNEKNLTDEETTGHTLRTSSGNKVMQGKENYKSAEEGEDTHHDENQASKGNDDNDNGVQSDVEVDSRVDSHDVTNDAGEASNPAALIENESSNDMSRIENDEENQSGNSGDSMESDGTENETTDGYTSKEINARAGRSETKTNDRDLKLSQNRKIESSYEVSKHPCLEDVAGKKDETSSSEEAEQLSEHSFNTFVQHDDDKHIDTDFTALDTRQEKEAKLSSVVQECFTDDTFVMAKNEDSFQAVNEIKEQSDFAHSGYMDGNSKRIEGETELRTETGLFSNPLDGPSERCIAVTTYQRLDGCSREDDDISKLKNELENLKEENRNQVQRRIAAETATEKAIAEVTRLKSKLEMSTVTLDEERQENEEIKEKLEKQQEHITRLKEAEECLQKKLNDTEEEMKLLNESISEKSDENADLVHRVITAETVRDETIAEFTSLKSTQEKITETLKQERLETQKLHDKVQELQEQITSHEETEDDLRKKLNSTEEELKRLNESLRDKIDENAVIEQRRVTAERTRDDTNVELERLESEHNQLKGKMDEERQEKEQVIGTLQALQGHIKRQKDTEESLKRTLQQERVEKDNIKERVRQQEEQILRQKATEECLQSQAKQQLEKLHTELVTVKGNINIKQGENKQLKGELDQSKKNCSELKTLKDKYEAEAIDHLRAIAELKADLNAKEEERKAVIEHMQKVVREKQELVHTTGFLQNLELEKAHLQQKNQYLLEQNAKLHASIQEYGLLRDHIQEYYKLVQESQMELAREKERCRHVNELLSTTGHRLSSMADELRNYRSMAETYRRTLEEEKEKYHRMDKEMNRLSMKNEQLTEERDKSCGECFEYKDQCMSLREDLEKLKAEYRELMNRTQNDAPDGTNISQQVGFFASTPNRQAFQIPNNSQNIRHTFGFGK